MTDREIARRLAHIHRTLELIAFLLAVLLAVQGGVGLLAGGVAAVLLVANALARSLGTEGRESPVD